MDSGSPSSSNCLGSCVCSSLIFSSTYKGERVRASERARERCKGAHTPVSISSRDLGGGAAVGNSNRSKKNSRTSGSTAIAPPLLHDVPAASTYQLPIYVFYFSGTHIFRNAGHGADDLERHALELRLRGKPSKEGHDAKVERTHRNESSRAACTTQVWQVLLWQWRYGQPSILNNCQAFRAGLIYRPNKLRPWSSRGDGLDYAMVFIVTTFSTRQTTSSRKITKAVSTRRYATLTCPRGHGYMYACNGLARLTITIDYTIASDMTTATITSHKRRTKNIHTNRSKRLKSSNKRRQKQRLSSVPLPEGVVQDLEHRLLVEVRDLVEEDSQRVLEQLLVHRRSADLWTQARYTTAIFIRAVSTPGRESNRKERLVLFGF